MTAEGTGATGGTLYVVATPIGNLGDITLRALEVLRSVDLVAAEDTRVTQGLLVHHGIRVGLLSLHAHNERSRAAQVVAALAEGRSVALVSDAGTPAVSDPGAALVAEVRAAGHPVVPVPGASALTAALSVAGFGSGRHLFLGFLEAQARARRTAIEAVASLPHSLVLYEAPHRIAACAADLLAVLGPERRVLVGRELTKLHETVHETRLADLPAWLAADEYHQRGEFVLVVEGAAPAGADDLGDAPRVLDLLLSELPPSRAARLAHEITGASRNALYALALERAKHED